MICHNPPVPGLPVHALPVLNHDWTDHNRKPMEHWCIGTLAWTSWYCVTSSFCRRIAEGWSIFMDLSVILPITVTVNVALTCFPLISVAVYTTSVLPMRNVSPGWKFEVSVTTPELSVTVIFSLHSTIADGNPGSVLTVMLVKLCAMTSASRSRRKKVPEGL